MLDESSTLLTKIEILKSLFPSDLLNSVTEDLLLPSFFQSLEKSPNTLPSSVLYEILQFWSFLATVAFSPVEEI